MLYSDCGEVDSKLMLPTKLDLYEFSEVKHSEVLAELQMVTPVALVSAKTRNNSPVGYQDKLNGFPSFYQLIRSAVFRLFSLTMLYVDSSVGNDKTAVELAIDRFLQRASTPFVIYANMRYVKLYSTPKKGLSNVYVFSGYVGRIAFAEVWKPYAVLLAEMSHLNIGNDINYGLGSICLLR